MEGLNYHHDGKTAWVKTGVTLVEETEAGIRELEHIEYLPIMDMKNASIPLGQITSFQVNKAIQRSLTKAIARHGLGLYIYAGEDLPEEEPAPAPVKKKPEPAPELTGEAKLLMDKIDPVIRKMTANMTPEQKKAFASELKALVGTANYRNIADVSSLKKLYDKYVKE